jgi:hypothetical protein
LHTLVQKDFQLPKLAFDSSTFIESIKLNTVFSGADVEHWKNWLGTTTWKTITEECDELIVSWVPTNTPEISGDADTREAEKKAFVAVQSFATATSHCFSYTDSFFFLSGSGQLKAGKVEATDIRSFSRLSSFTMPFFIDKAGKEDPYFNHVDACSDWVGNYSLIMKYVFTDSHIQIRESYRSLVEASKGKQLEFKIPNLVRAIECLLVCSGAKDFAAKLLWILGTPPVDNEFSIHMGTFDKFVDLYQMRNDCSHGKEFAWSLNKNHKISDLNYSIGSYEFLAEWAARAIFRKVINGNFVHFYKNRDSLESAATSTIAIYDFGYLEKKTTSDMDVVDES